MMSQAKFGAEGGALSIQRELSMKEDSMVIGAFGQVFLRLISTQRRNSHEQFCERRAITQSASSPRGSARRQAGATRCDRRARAHQGSWRRALPKFNPPLI